MRMDLYAPLTQSLIALVQSEYKSGYLYSRTEIAAIFGVIFPGRHIANSYSLFERDLKEFREKYFIEGGAYWHLHPKIQTYVDLLNEEDPLWEEFISLSEFIRENLYSTPFMVKCDDRDFLQGAMETALADVDEECWFDWVITHDNGEFYEIDRFEG